MKKFSTICGVILASLAAGACNSIVESFEVPGAHADETHQLEDFPTAELKDTEEVESCECEQSPPRMLKLHEVQCTGGTVLLGSYNDFGDIQERNLRAWLRVHPQLVEESRIEVTADGELIARCPIPSNGLSVELWGFDQ